MSSLVGGGLTAGLVARQLTAQNIDVLVLERGILDHRNGAESRLPSQRDELRWATRQGLDAGLVCAVLIHCVTTAAFLVSIRSCWMAAFSAR